MSRLCRVLLIAAVALGVAAPSAGAAPDKKLGATLGAMWERVLETPTAQSDLPCVDLRGVVAPLDLFGEGTIECPVKPGTKIFVAAFSVECSTLEVNTPFFGSNEAELRACVERLTAGVDVQASLDGRSVPLTEVRSGLLRIDLPKDNILGVPGPDTGLSLAGGFVALLHPLTPGTHTIEIRAAGLPSPFPPVIENTTTIIVEPGR
jgi:hypothetical protein